MNYEPFDRTRAETGDAIYERGSGKPLRFVAYVPNTPRGAAVITLDERREVQCFGEKEVGMRPRAKKIDWAKVAVDTPVLVRGAGRAAWLCRRYAEPGATFPNGADSYAAAPGLAAWPEMQLDFGAPFLYWPGGTTAPLPEGVMVEVIRRAGDRDANDAAFYIWRHSKNARGDEIIAYRAVGLAQGWEF